MFAPFLSEDVEFNGSNHIIDRRKGQRGKIIQCKTKPASSPAQRRAFTLDPYLINLRLLGDQLLKVIKITIGLNILGNERIHFLPTPLFIPYPFILIWCKKTSHLTCSKKWSNFTVMKYKSG